MFGPALGVAHVQAVGAGVLYRKGGRGAASRGHEPLPGWCTPVHDSPQEHTLHGWCDGLPCAQLSEPLSEGRESSPTTFTLAPCPHAQPGSLDGPCRKNVNLF
eukprot:1153277-Pelagomonas_calceolata.AAC.2